VCFGGEGGLGGVGWGGQRERALEAGDGGVVVGGGGVRVGEEEVDLGRVGGEGLAALGGVERFVGAALEDEELGERVVGGEDAGVALDGGAEEGDGVVGLACAVQVHRAADLLERGGGRGRRAGWALGRHRWM
jgi:hypothetical protein